MKQKKRMLLLVGILVVLCGAYGGIKAWNNQMKTQKAAKKKAQTVQIIDADDLTKISYKKGNKNMTFVKKNDTLCMKKIRPSN